MAEMERRTIGFSRDEVAEIERIQENDLDQALLRELLSGLQAYRWRASLPQGKLTSFSDVVRTLTRVGLVQLLGERQAWLYRRAAAEAAEAVSREELAGMGRSAMQALQAVVPEATQQSRQAVEVGGIE